MKKKHSSKKTPGNDALQGLALGLTAFAALLPIIHNPWGFNLYAPTRVGFLFSGTAILLGLWVYKVLTTPNIAIFYRRSDRFFLIFLAVIGLSTAFSVHKHSSVYGHFLRYEGLLAWAAYLALFFLAKQAFGDRKTINQLAVWLARGAILISLYAVFQRLGLDYTGWQQDLVTNRSFSTLGNPAYLGAYISLVLPLILAMIFGGRIEHKSLFIISLAALLAALAFTLTRGAWVSAAVTTGVFAFFGLSPGSKRATARTVWVAGALTITAVLLFAYTTKTGNNALSGLQSALERQGSVEGRIMTWKQTLPLILKYPVLGSGPDTLYLTFSGQITPEYEQKIARDTATDRAHNEFLQIAATTGFAGLMTYVTVLALIFSAGISILRAQGESLRRLFVFGSVNGMLGYLLMLQTHFSSIDVSPIFWILAGAVVAQDRQNELFLRLNARRPLLAKNRQQYALVSLAVIAVTVIIISARPGVADIYFRKAKEAEKSGVPMLAIMNMETALSLDGRNDFYLTELGRLYLTYAPQAKNPSFFDRSIQLFTLARNFNPLNEYTYLHLGNAYLAAFEYANKKSDLKKAIAYLRQGQAIDANYADLRLKLGLAYAYEGRYRLATREWLAAAKLAPRSAAVNYNLGRLFQDQGKTEEANKFYRRVLAIEPTHARAKEALSRRIPGQIMWSRGLASKKQTFGAQSMAITTSGNVYLGGSLVAANSASGPRFAIAKYSKSGKKLWGRAYRNAKNSKSRAQALVVTPTGQIFAAGFTETLDNSHLIIRKYSPGGQLIWSKENQDVRITHEDPVICAAGKGGNLYAVGRDAENTAGLKIAKYDVDGALLWAQSLAPPSSSKLKLTAVVADKSGHLYLGANVTTENKRRLVLVAKYNRNGLPVWEKTLENRHDQQIASLAVSGDGEIYIAGTASFGPSNDFMLIALDQAGNRRWETTYNGPGDGEDSAAAVAVGGRGNIYITGSSYGGPKTKHDYATIKYDSSGRRLWLRRHNGQANGDDFGKLIAFQKDRLIVAGTSFGNSHGVDIAVIKYDAKGQKIWVRRQGALDHSDDHPSNMASDKQGATYLLGSFSRPGSAPIEPSSLLFMIAP